MFEWDPDKDRANIAKHGLSFAQAARIFEGPTLTLQDDMVDYGEIREISLGLIPDLFMVAVVVHTDRDGRTRIISARPATRRERRGYEEAIFGPPDRG